MHRKHNPCDDAPDGVEPAAVDRFTKSCAGFCVATYLLGIGDRHLDNIMLKKTGELFHIDFGFILGKDPKVYLPFRLTKEMAEAMGYPDKDNWNKNFKTKCCQAFNCLRKSAALILSLMTLMKDAGISDLKIDPDTALLKMQERFRLDLTDEEAERYFLVLINDCLQAILPRIIEQAHKTKQTPAADPERKVWPTHRTHPQKGWNLIHRSSRSPHLVPDRAHSVPLSAAPMGGH